MTLWYDRPVIASGVENKETTNNDSMERESFKVKLQQRSGAAERESETLEKFQINMKRLWSQSVDGIFWQSLSFRVAK